MSGVRKTIRNLFVVVLVGALTLVSGCTTKKNTTESETKLVIGATAMPQSMDMLAHDGSATPQALLYNVYETLIKLDDKGNTSPGLATEWTVSQDRTVYTFKLNPDAKFASGARLDAEVVVKSIEHARSGSNTSPTIRNHMAPISKVTAVDPQTVQVTLTSPSNNWLFHMSQSAGIIVEPNHLNDMDKASYGSGPYVLSEWKEGESLTLKRNEKYWGEKPYYSTVVFKYYADSNAENMAMLASDLDIISTVAAPQALQTFRDDSRFNVYEGTSTLEVLLAINHATEPLSKLKVRQAIAYGINRQAFIDTVWSGVGMPIGSMVPPTDPWYEDLTGIYSYDPEKAKALLAEAGYADGLTLRLRVPTLPYATDGARFIASQLKEIGITVQIDELEFPARWIDVVMGQKDYDLSIIAHAEPRDIVMFANPDYYWNYDNPEVAKLITEAERGDEETMNDKMKQAARLIGEDVAAEFLFLLPNPVVTKTGIENVPINATTMGFDVTKIKPTGA